MLKQVGSKNVKSNMKRYNAEKSKGYNVVKKPRNHMKSPNRVPGGEGGQEEPDFGELSHEVQQYM